MCKTKKLNEIENILLGIFPVDEKAKAEITDYCSKLGIVADFCICSNKSVVSFKQFLSFVESRLPKRNDIVLLSCDNSHVIVKGCDYELIVASVSKLSNGDILLDEKEIPLCDFSFVSKIDLTELQISLSKLGLEWDSYKGKITPKQIPHTNQQIRITQLGVKVGIGVLKEIAENKDIVLYCFVCNDDVVDYSMNYVVGEVDAYQIELMDMNEREEFSQTLKSKGVIWNGYQRRVEPADLRVNIGEVYYYVDSLFSVVATKEQGKPKDYKRFKALNYFNNREDAFRYKEIMYTERLKLFFD